MASPTSSHVNGNDGDDYGKYLTLYRASVAGNWEEAQNFFNEDNKDNEAIIQAAPPINHHLDTALHVAAKTDNEFFAQKLVAKLADNDNDNDNALIGLKNQFGLTPLHLAARFGNIKVAKILVERNYNLLYERCNKGLFPIHYAACNTRNNKDVYRYFYAVTKDNNDAQPNPYATQTGATILVNLIKSKFYDLATELVDKYPDLTRHKALDSGESEGLPPLLALVQYDFPVITQSSIPDSRVMHQEAVKLVKCLCKKSKTLNDPQVASSIASRAILEAAYLDMDEVVENVVEEYPATAYCHDDSGRNILHIAVENRCKNVFNLVCGTRVLMHDLVAERDKNKNNIVHLAAKLAPPHKLNLVSGAALQMQRELQWFKEVKKIALPYYSSMKNGDGKTPNRVFTEEHKELKTEGEKWMKDTATSCSILAALIVTVMFAAAITVPGGNSDGESTFVGTITVPLGTNNNVSNIFPGGYNGNITLSNHNSNSSDEKPPPSEGLPIFSRADAFIIFYFSNGLSLFTSVTSLLVFLSILTLRYAEQDFLYALPKRILIGLLTLSLSIMFMMAAFSTTAYLVFGKRKISVRIVLIAFSIVPVILFVIYQFRLLVALLSSTYGRGIFKKRNNLQSLF